MTSSKKGRLMTIEDAAEELGVSPNRVRADLMNGSLDGKKNSQDQWCVFLPEHRPEAAKPSAPQTGVGLGEEGRAATITPDDAFQDQSSDRESEITRLCRVVAGQNETLGTALAMVEKGASAGIGNVLEDPVALRQMLVQILSGPTSAGDPEEPAEPGSWERQLEDLLHRTRTALATVSTDKARMEIHNGEMEVLLAKGVELLDRAAGHGIENLEAINKMSLTLSRALDAMEYGTGPDANVVSMVGPRDVTLERSVERLRAMVAERTQLHELLVERECLLQRCIAMMETALDG